MVPPSLQIRGAMQGGIVGVLGSDVGEEGSHSVMRDIQQRCHSEMMVFPHILTSFFCKYSNENAIENSKNCNTVQFFCHQYLSMLSILLFQFQ